MLAESRYRNMSDKIPVLRLYTIRNAINMPLSAKQVETVFKAGCGVSALKPDGTASAILPVPVGTKVNLPFPVTLKGITVLDGRVPEVRARFRSFKLIAKAAVNRSALWECYNARMTEAV
jgi:hypothetical protein